MQDYQQQQLDKKQELIEQQLVEIQMKQEESQKRYIQAQQLNETLQKQQEQQITYQPSINSSHCKENQYVQQLNDQSMNQMNSDLMMSKSYSKSLLGVSLQPFQVDQTNTKSVSVNDLMDCQIYFKGKNIQYSREKLLQLTSEERTKFFNNLVYSGFSYGRGPSFSRDQRFKSKERGLHVSPGPGTYNIKHREISSSRSRSREKSQSIDRSRSHRRTASSEGRMGSYTNGIKKYEQVPGPGDYSPLYHYISKPIVN